MLPKQQTPILIVGAGPTGLVLALALARRRIPIRIVSAAEGPGTQSRAMVVHARTLEFYHQFGFAEAMVAEGIVTGSLHVREVGARSNGRTVTSVGLQQAGKGISPYPFVLTYAQDDHERFLIGKLASEGVAIEWRTRLLSFEQDAAGVRAHLQRADGGLETAEAAYLCGCDGAHSRVRQAIGVGFPGGTYEQLFHVADVRLDAPFNSDLRVNLGARTLELVLPVRSTGMNRLIGLVPPELSDRDDLRFEDIRSYVEPLIGSTVAAVNWFSTYRVHHRVAERFRIGRAFLAGDAGHLHSPAGGQGMNTGIGDAVNLGWKLAQVSQGKASDSLLDTYETERIGFARQLVTTTDRAFTLAVMPGRRGALARRLLVPLLVGVTTRFAAGRRLLFRTLSQTRINYRRSGLSRGFAGRVGGGDRLPWMGDTDQDNFAPLQSLDWQVHVFGAMPDGLARFCRETELPVHAFRWNSAAASAGFVQDGAYLVRPDGYVAVAAKSEDAVMAFDGFLKEWGLRAGRLVEA